MGWGPVLQGRTAGRSSPPCARRRTTHAAIMAREVKPSLRRMFSTCPCAVRTEMTSRSAISGFERPSATNPATSVSRCVNGDGSADASAASASQVSVEGVRDHLLLGERRATPELGPEVAASPAGCAPDAPRRRRRPCERIPGVAHPDRVPDGVGGTESMAARRSRPCASATLARTSSATRDPHPVPQLGLDEQCLEQELGGPFELTGAERQLTQPRQGVRPPEGLADFLRRGDARR